MNTEKSVFQQSAENGISFGLYLSAIFFTIVYAEKLPVLSLIGLILILAIPVILYRYIRKFHISHIETSNFSLLWTLGTLTFLCGSLICSVATFIWLEYVLPDFIFEQAKNTLALYEQSPDLKNIELVQLLRSAIENGTLPSPIEIVMQMLWSSFTLGVMLSLVLAPLVKLKMPKRNK